VKPRLLGVQRALPVRVCERHGVLAGVACMHTAPRRAGAAPHSGASTLPGGTSKPQRTTRQSCGPHSRGRPAAGRRGADALCRAAQAMAAAAALASAAAQSPTGAGPYGGPGAGQRSNNSDPGPDPMGSRGRRRFAGDADASPTGGRAAKRPAPVAARAGLAGFRAARPRHAGQPGTWRRRLYSRP